MLVQEGLVRELRVDDTASRYDADTSQHHHATCQKCGRVTDYFGPSLDSLLREAESETGYRLESAELYFEGLCPACQASNNVAP